MLSSSSSSPDFKHYKDKQNSPTWKLAIWETAYQRELDRFWKIVTQKATYCQTLEQQDFFLMPEDAAKKKIKQIGHLRKELNAMVGLKLFVDNLKEMYLQSSVWLLESTKLMETNFLQKLDEYQAQKEVAQKRELYYKGLLENIQRELDEKGIILNTKINVVWTS